jgi:hypothetical protein
MTLEKVPGSIGKFRNTETGEIIEIASWWEVDLFSKEFTIADDRSAYLAGRVPEDFVLSRVLYTFAAGVSPRDREVFKHRGKVSVGNGHDALFSLPAFLFEYSTEAVAEIVRLIQSGNCAAGLEPELKPWVTDAARVAMQGWKLAQPGLFKKDALWEVRLSVEDSCSVQGTIVGLGLARRPRTT